MLDSRQSFFLIATLMLSGAAVGCASTPSAPPPADPITTTLSASDRADQAEAKVFLDAIAKGQKVLYLEKNKFSPTISEVGIGAPEKTEAYQFALQSDATSSVITATSLKPNLKSYATLVVVSPSGITSLMCETNEAGKPPIAPVNQGGTPQCPTGTTPIS